MAEHITLTSMLRHHARVRPEKLALVFESDAIDYAMLELRSRRVANGLVTAGVVAGDRIAYIGRNSAAYYEILFAATRIGAVLMPINWRLADAEIAYILDNGGTRALFAEPDYLARLAATGMTLPLTVALDNLGIADSYAAWRDAQPSADVDAVIDADQVAMQLYTSGTTGKPKGAMLSHRSILGLRAEVPESDQPSWNRWSDSDVSILPLPLFHIGTAAWGLIGIYYGATSIIQTEFEASSFIDAIEIHGVTRLCMVPSALKLMIEHERAAEADFSSIAYCFYGASPIPLVLLKAAIERIGCDFVQIYGMTETSGAIMGLPPEDHDVNGSRHMLSAGKAYPGVEVEIRDTEGHALPDGGIGEVTVRSIANMIGYFGNDEATCQTVDADGWLRTGDAGYLEDGYLFIHDRIKEMIISGGENVYPAEVEAALHEHPAIADVAVIGIPDPKWGEAVKAVVVLKAGEIAGEADIVAWAKTRIAGYKAPKSIDFVETLPRNPSGKLLRKDLREPYWIHHERRVN